jgi:predicted NBD/HSP70 family sugar kinase
MDLRRPTLNDFGVLDNESLRSVNETIVLNVIREKQPISRADLARITRLKESTISSIAKRLIGEGLIYEASLGDSSGGRPPRMLRINGNRSAAIGVHIAPHESLIATSDFSGKILRQRTIKTDRDPERFLPRLAGEIERALHSDLPTGIRCEGIGVSMPGLMDRSQGKIIYSSNLDWREVEVGAHLRRRFDHDLVFEDNVRCAGLAEIWFGSLTPSAPSHMINLLIDEGLGTAIIIGGHLYRGATLGAGQFGHVSIDPSGPRCRCGNLGCWESYASNTATLNRYLQAKAQSAAISITFSELITRAREGDRDAAAALQQTGEYLGIGIALLVNGLNPEMIIVSGEISHAWDLIEADVWRNLRIRALAGNLNSMKLLPSGIEGNPSVVGAISLVICRRFALPPPSRDSRRDAFSK